MILAFDTYYFDNKAKTVCLSFDDFKDSEPKKTYIETIESIADYEPGLFYKRELPCILSLIKTIDLSNVKTIIVDSYVYLDDSKKIGLGGYLHKELNEEIPIIGVAKSSFESNKKLAKPLLRGESKKPLYVSAIGMELEDAYNKIKSMSGNYRMPTLLQILDAETKKI